MTREGEVERPESRVVIPPAESVRVTSSVTTKTSCPYCHGPLDPELLAARCVACQTAHHTTCFDEHGGCSVHGCSGKIARVGKLGGKTERAVLAPCHACKTTVHLDENLALCEVCESIHHPRCFETHGSCARCGGFDAILVSAGTYRRAAHEPVRGSPWGVGAIVAAMILAMTAVVVLVSFGNPLVVGLLTVGAVLEAVVGVAVLVRSRPPTGLAALKKSQRLG